MIMSTYGSGLVGGVADIVVVEDGGELGVSVTGAVSHRAGAESLQPHSGQVAV